MPDLRASAREPSDQRPEHEPGLGCERDIRGHADDDAERQAQHGSKPDSGSDAHMRESKRGECGGSATSATLQPQPVIALDPERAREIRATELAEVVRDLVEL